MTAGGKEHEDAEEPAALFADDEDDFDADPDDDDFDEDDEEDEDEDDENAEDPETWQVSGAAGITEMR